MNFQYTAKSASGQTTTGLLEALSHTEARQQLRQQGLFALSMEEHAEAKQGGSAVRQGWFVRSRVTKRDLLLLS